MTSDLIKERLAALPGGAPPGVRGRFAAEARPMRCAPGDVVFRQGDAAAAFFFVIDGGVRVETTAPGGRSAVLYRVRPGESCVMTSSCLLSARVYAADAVAEEPTLALAASKAVFLRLIGEDAAFREHVFGSFAERLADVTGVIEDLLLRRVDARLALLLAEGAPRIEATHDRLAQELGASREAVSRILKDFERRGWTATGRGRVDVAAPEALRAFAAALGARPR